MDRKHSIIEYLYKNHFPCTIAQIAIATAIPKRSVQRYISEIREEYPQMIEVSKNQYKIDPAEYSAYIKNRKEEYNSIKKIINRLFSDFPINEYDLSEELYISTSTLSNQLKKVVPILSKYSLSLEKKHGDLSIKGSEKNKRLMIKDYLYGETYMSLMDPSGFETIFGNYNIKEIQESIISTFTEWNLYIDDYTLCNLILHIIIKIDRNIDDHTLVNERGIDLKEYKSKAFYRIAKEICDKISKIEEISFSDIETYELGLIISSNVHLDKNIVDIQDIFAEANILTNTVVSTIKDVYDLDFDDPVFKKNFSLHVDNLLLRLKNNIILHNPLLQQIKNTYPFVYEIAIYIGNVVFEPYGCISEDELAYITLHLVAQIDKIHSIQTKVSSVLISPEFYSLNKKIISKLKSEFGESLYIRDVLNSSKKLSQVTNHYDLVISTVDLSEIKCSNYVLINHLMNNNDINKIRQAITNLQIDKSTQSIVNILDDFTDDKFFFKYDQIVDYAVLINELSNHLKKYGIVDDAFSERCIEREKISSTAFKEIAIPHAVRHADDTTFIIVAVNKKYFVWGNGNKVKVAFLMVIAKTDINKLKPLFDFIAIYANSNKPLYDLTNCNNIQQFKDTFTSFVKEM